MMQVLSTGKEIDGVKPEHVRMMKPMRVFEVLGIKNITTRHVLLIAQQVHREFPAIKYEEFDQVIQRGLNEEFNSGRQIEPTYAQVKHWLKEAQNEYLYAYRSFYGVDAVQFAVDTYWESEAHLKDHLKRTVEDNGNHVIADRLIPDSAWVAINKTEANQQNIKTFLTHIQEYMSTKTEEELRHPYYERTKTLFVHLKDHEV